MSVSVSVALVVLLKPARKLKDRSVAGSVPRKRTPPGAWARCTWAIVELRFSVAPLPLSLGRDLVLSERMAECSRWVGGWVSSYLK